MAQNMKCYKIVWFYKKNSAGGCIVYNVVHVPKTLVDLPVLITGAYSSGPNKHVNTPIYSQ